jgi:peptidoglycan/xylan/chitin deacetylase (PgdA/CDA1 family)
MHKKMVISMVLVLICGLSYSGWLSLSQQGKPLSGIPPANVSQPEPATALPVGVPVLMYHSIGSEQNNDAVIAKEHFMEQMTYLYQHHYQPISLDDLQAYLAERKELPIKPVLITFDDGYRDTYEIALPVLKQYHFRSVLFIPAGEAGKRLSWQELQEMKAAGMEIASHSVNHHSLGDLSPAEQQQEIRDSKEQLDRFLHQNTRYFCYPNGSYTEDTVQLLQANGYKLAFTIDPGWVKLGDNPFTLRRIWMGNSIDLGHLEERLSKENYSVL